MAVSDACVHKEGEGVVTDDAIEVGHVQGEDLDNRLSAYHNKRSDDTML